MKKTNITDESKAQALNKTDVKRSASIEVISIPSHILLSCPHCDEEVEIKYSDFCEMVGEPCDWKYSALDCPECEKSIEIDSVDWV